MKDTYLAKCEKLGVTFQFVFVRIQMKILSMSQCREAIVSGILNPNSSF